MSLDSEKNIKSTRSFYLREPPTGHGRLVTFDEAVTSVIKGKSSESWFTSFLVNQFDRPVSVSEALQVVESERGRRAVKKLERAMERSRRRPSRMFSGC